MHNASKNSHKSLEPKNKYITTLFLRMRMSDHGDFQLYNIAFNSHSISHSVKIVVHWFPFKES